MFGAMSMMKLAAPLCLLQASMIGLVSGLSLPPPMFLQSTIEGNFPGGNQFCVSVNDGSKKPDDLRDGASFYVNTRNTCESKTVFQLIPAFDEGGFVIQARDIRTQLQDVARNWYLAVHDNLASDIDGEGDLRVILHKDFSRAAVWEFSSVNGKAVMSVASNRDPTGVASVGCYLATADEPFRSANSFYLSVTDSPNDALPISATPEVAF